MTDYYCKFCQLRLSQIELTHHFCLPCQTEYFQEVDNQYVFLHTSVNSQRYCIDVSPNIKNTTIWSFEIIGYDIFSSTTIFQEEDLLKLHDYQFYWEVIDVLPNSFADKLTPQNINQKLLTIFNFQ